MKKIASFCVDHTKLKKGIYVSRVDGDVVTYDLRMCTPNAGSYLENAAQHTFEHLFATYARNSKYTDSVVYVGPMGCRTGFYFLVRDTMSHAEVIGSRMSVPSSQATRVKSPEIRRSNAATISTMTCRVRGRWGQHLAKSSKIGPPK